MLICVKWYDVMSYHVMSYHAMWCHIMLLMSCHVMSCDVMWSQGMWCCVMWCHVMCVFSDNFFSDNCSLVKSKNVNVTEGPYVSCQNFILLSKHLFDKILNNFLVYVFIHFWQFFFCTFYNLWQHYLHIFNNFSTFGYENLKFESNILGKQNCVAFGFQL